MHIAELCTENIIGIILRKGSSHMGLMRNLFSTLRSEFNVYICIRMYITHTHKYLRANIHIFITVCEGLWFCKGS